MEKLVLVGGGPFAKCTINYIEDEEKYEIVGYTDLEDNGDILGYKYLGKDEEVLSKLFAEGVKYAVVGAGNHLNDCTIKEKITNKVKSYGFILLLSMASTLWFREVLSLRKVLSYAMVPSFRQVLW